MISVGMVDETGAREFYAEVADTWSPPQCSKFCLREAIPHLQGEPFRQPLNLIRSDREAWLSTDGARVTLICDAAADVDQLPRHFPAVLPAGVKMNVLGSCSGRGRRPISRDAAHHKQGL